MKSILLFVLLFILLVCSKAQDLQFLNNNQSLLLLNPSFAGSNGNWRFQSSYGNINPNLSSSNTLSYLSADAIIKPLKGAISLGFVNNIYSRGLLREQFIHLGYAKQITIGDKKFKLIPSLQVSYMQRQLELQSITFGSPYVQMVTNGPVNSTKVNYDITCGVLTQYKNFTGGLAVWHITQPDIGLIGTTPLARSINIHSSYTQKIHQKMMVQFFANYNHQASLNTIQLQVNSLVYSHLIVGVGSNTFNQTMFSLGYRNKYISTCASYGFNWSKLAGGAQNAFNFSLAFKLPKEKVSDPYQSFEQW